MNKETYYRTDGREVMNNATHATNGKLSIYFFSKVGTYSTEDLILESEDWEPGYDYDLDDDKTNIILVRDEKERWASGVAQEMGQMFNHQEITHYTPEEMEKFFRKFVPPYNPVNVLLYFQHSHLGYNNQFPYIKSMWTQFVKFMNHPTTYFCDINDLNKDEFWDKFDMDKPENWGQGNRSIDIKNKDYIKQYCLKLLDEKLGWGRQEPAWYLIKTQLEQNQQWLDDLKKTDKWLCL